MTKKQEILSITKEIIHTKGYQATSISDILKAASIGKGQFYHYFSSKYELGLEVVDEIIREWNQQLIVNILQTTGDPKSKLDQMLNWAITYHVELENKSGCPIGNLAIEMSEHDDTFRIKISEFMESWIQAVKNVLDEMILQKQLNQDTDARKHAQAIVAMIEGGILLMKNRRNGQIFLDIIDVIKRQYQLT